ncbi:protocadherin-11 X-linked-like [Trachypithecus francoisi]|uniref:protocadherin-11 X-linked-like n=1 Tax=Trachypithecus francoisi TaxID=54180 RepID=UPI00141A8BA6|nr:protocadherin-11 X-linked-like [Trachypithecus francoisi]
MPNTGCHFSKTNLKEKYLHVTFYIPVYQLQPDTARKHGIDSLQWGNWEAAETAEITVQPTVEEASDNCTQECLIYGHSDACWMPASLNDSSSSQAQASALRHSPPLSQASTHHHSPPVTQTIALCHSPPVTQTIALCHSPPPIQISALHHSPPLVQATALRHSPPSAQASALCYSPPLAQAAAICHSSPLPQVTALHRSQAQSSVSLQQGWVQGADGLCSVDQGVQGSATSQFYTMSERLHPSDDSIKVIPLTTFTPRQQARPSKGDSPIMEEHPL